MANPFKLKRRPDQGNASTEMTLAEHILQSNPHPNQQHGTSPGGSSTDIEQHNADRNAHAGVLSPVGHNHDDRYAPYIHTHSEYATNVALEVVARAVGVNTASIVDSGITVIDPPVLSYYVDPTTEVEDTTRPTSIGSISADNIGTGSWYIPENHGFQLYNSDGTIKSTLDSVEYTDFPETGVSGFVETYRGYCQGADYVVYGTFIQQYTTTSGHIWVRSARANSKPINVASNWSQSSTSKDLIYDRDDTTKVVGYREYVTEYDGECGYRSYINLYYFTTAVDEQKVGDEVDVDATIASGTVDSGQTQSKTDMSYQLVYREFGAWTSVLNNYPPSEETDETMVGKTLTWSAPAHDNPLLVTHNCQLMVGIEGNTVSTAKYKISVIITPESGSSIEYVIADKVNASKWITLFKGQTIRLYAFKNNSYHTNPSVTWHQAFDDTK